MSAQVKISKINPTLEIVDSCETCAHPHKFDRNKREGVCLRDLKEVCTISRSSHCRFHLTDIAVVKQHQDLLLKPVKYS